MQRSISPSRSYLTSIAKIERDTGISFFPELPEPTRTTVENDVEERMW